MEEGGKTCFPCLLRDMDQEEEYRKFREYLDSFPQEIRADQEEYERRLSLCRECGSLQEGICGKCGCFVEARALRSNGYCPHEDPRW